MGSVRGLLQRGWLDLAFDGGDFDRRWMVLDNGVLWVHRDNVCSINAEHVIPLHDAEVHFVSSSSGSTISVQLASPRRRLQLRAVSDKEYQLWTAAMLEAAQLWHARRQMALTAVLPSVADLAGDSAARQRTPLPGLVEGRMLLVQCLAQALVQVSELRAKTRRAVTQNRCDADLPRFIRRAIADAVERIWKACGRARCRADTGQLEVYDAVLVLREAVDAFVTYCSLLRDLEVMLREDSGGGDDPLTFSPICCLSALRDVLDRLTPLILSPEEKDRHSAALAAVDTILQRCWTELSAQQMEMMDSASLNREEPAPAATGPPRPAKGGARSVRRLASRLQRDVVRLSVRRARKRARVEGQALLADTVEMTALPPSPLARDAQPESSSESSSLATTDTSSDDGTLDERPAVQKADETPENNPCDDDTTVTACSDTDSDSDQRIDRHAGLQDFGGSLCVIPGRDQDAPRHRADKTLWRRRRLICSAGDFDSRWTEGGDEDLEDPVLEDPAGETQVREKSSDKRPSYGGLVEEKDISEVVRDNVASAPSVKEDLRLLDVPVTPATPNGGGRRALWCETREVQQSGLLDRLNTAESALQEAKFEVLSSEESYLRSLDLLAHRVQSIEALQDPTIIADHDRDAIFKFLDSARACSLRLVSALRALWSLDMLLRGLCTLMHKEASPGASLQQYVNIVALQPRAASALLKIGSLEANQLVPLLSLPAQRASRLPLLLAAILRRLDQRTSEAIICRSALDRLNQIVFECNESLRRAEHTERMAQLGRMLFEEKSPTKSQKSWRERKNSVVVRAKSFFLKSNSRIGAKTNKVLTSTSSMLHLT